MTDVISSRTNSRVKALRQLVRQRPAGKLIVEGARLGAELAAAKLPVETLAYTPAFAADEAGRTVVLALQASGPGTVLCLSDDVLASIADTRTPQGLLAVAAAPVWGGRDDWIAACRDNCPSLVLDAVADPGNVGTIWRTAAALAGGPLLAGPGTADLFAPKVVRAAMGAAFWHPAWQAPDLVPWLEEGRRAGLRIVATAVSVATGRVPTALPDFSFAPGTVVVIGSEAHGVSRDVLALADDLLHISLPGRAESLNAAVAASLVLYEAGRGSGGR